MIVKDEAHIIRRCLESTLPLIDCALVVDTGSTDGTQEIVRAFLREHGLPGGVIDEPWQDFARNRSFALRKLRERQDIDYGLMIDADSLLLYDPDFDAQSYKQSMKADLNDVIVRVEGASAVFHSPLIFSNRLPLVYKGALHEYLEVSPSHTREPVRGIINHHFQDSARNQSIDKFKRDAAVLERELRTETDPFLRTRYTFYLAQSYYDSEEREKSLETYRLRSRMGGWEQEIFISHYRMGTLLKQLGRPDAEIIQTYLDAYEACPQRSESLYAAARWCRRQRKFQQAYLFAKAGVDIPFPSDPLFVEPAVYEFAMLDELAVAAYWAGHFREAFETCVKLLENPRVPASERLRYRQNALFAIEQLHEPALLQRLPDA
jgi:glycosyltransferase involved in cell wall biosynthesis